VILYDLSCGQAHSFEAWFASSSAYDTLHEAGHIACPVCNDTHVNKAPMAPRIGKGSHAERGGAAPVPPAPVANAEANRMIADFCRSVESSCDYVGKEFPEQARRIHYGESETRPIYGEATKEEAVELQEEGIEIAAVPWLKKPDA
jgi:hypothetical protein